jgi:hypothetical protein
MKRKRRTRSPRASACFIRFYKGALASQKCTTNYLIWFCAARSPVRKFLQMLRRNRDTVAKRMIYLLFFGFHRLKGDCTKSCEESIFRNTSTQAHCRWVVVEELKHALV